MHHHGKGPKDVLVRSYARWRRGKRQTVRMAHRAAWHRLRLRDSPDQFAFDF